MSSAVPAVIRNELDDIVVSFAQSPFAGNIKKILLFGSFATQKYQPESDIDLAVVVREPPAKALLADYYMTVDHIPRETDLLFCTEEQLLSGRYVFAKILREGITLYENV